MHISIFFTLKFRCFKEKNCKKIVKNESSSQDENKNCIWSCCATNSSCLMTLSSLWDDLRSRAASSPCTNKGHVVLCMRPQCVELHSQKQVLLWAAMFLKQRQLFVTPHLSISIHCLRKIKKTVYIYDSNKRSLQKILLL